MGCVGLDLLTSDHYSMFYRLRYCSWPRLKYSVMANAPTYTTASSGDNRKFDNVVRSSLRRVTFKEEDADDEHNEDDAIQVGMMSCVEVV
jgi:hypothetical protein